MASTEAQKKASAKWKAKQAQIAIRVKPEEKAAIDNYLAGRSETLARFIVRACLEQIEREKQNPAD